MRYSRDGYRSYRKSSRDRSERSFSPPPSRHSNPYRYVSNSRDPQYDRSHSRYSRHESNYYQSNNRSSGFWNTKSNDSHDYYRRSPDVIEPEEHFDTATEPHTTCIFEWKVLKDPELTKEVSEVQYYHADSSKNTPITTQNSRPSEPNDPRLKCDYTTTKKAHMNATSFDIDDNSNPLNLPPRVILCSGLSQSLSKVQIYGLLEGAYASLPSETEAERRCVLDRVDMLLNPVSLSFLGVVSVWFCSPLSPIALRHIKQHFLQSQCQNCVFSYDKEGRSFQRLQRELEFKQSETHRTATVNVTIDHRPPDLSSPSIHPAPVNSKSSTFRPEITHQPEIKHFCLKIESPSILTESQIRTIFGSFQTLNIFFVGRVCWVEFCDEAVCSLAQSVVSERCDADHKLSIIKSTLSHPLFTSLMRNSQKSTLELSRNLISCDEFSKISSEISTLVYTPDFVASPKKPHHFPNRFIESDESSQSYSSTAYNSDSQSNIEFNAEESNDLQSADVSTEEEEEFFVPKSKKACAEQSFSTPRDPYERVEALGCSRIIAITDLKVILGDRFSSTKKNTNNHSSNDAKVRTQRASARNLKSLLPEMELPVYSVRTKKLKLNKSGIHALGIFALENIDKNDFVIEYVGEVVRDKIAELREQHIYARMRDSSSYLFRIDQESVVDATFKGNLARFMNHSCDPSCTAKIISINGRQSICVYAKKDISIGDEITYDYKFPIEDEKIPCLCGAPNCRGSLN